MSEQYTNKARTTLNGAIDDNDLSLVVTSATGFPTSGDFRIIVSPNTANEEIMTVTAVSGTTFTISRATEAVAGIQTAFSHSNGATIAHVLTAGSLRTIPYGFIGAKAYNSGNQSIGSGEVAVTFDTEEYDTDEFHSTSSNTGRMTIPAGMAGRYRFTVSLNFDASSGGSYRFIYVKKNGSTYVGSSSGQPNSVAGPALNCTVDINLVPTDYIEAYVAQNTGGNLNLVANSPQERFISIEKLDAGRVGSGVGARAVETSAQSIPDATWTAITLNDTDSFDTDGFHDTGSNTSRMTIPAGLGGLYALDGFVGWTANGTGQRYWAFAKNGTRIRQVPNNPNASTNGAGESFNDKIQLNAGEYVEIHVYQDSTGSLNTTGADFSIMRLDSKAAESSEWDYVQSASNISVTGTNEAGATTILTSNAVTFDGRPVMFEFFSPEVYHDTANSNLVFVLYDGASAAGVLGRVFAPASVSDVRIPVHLAYRFSPSAATHTYSVRAFKTAGGPQVSGGTPGSAALVPMFIRITKI